MHKTRLSTWVGTSLLASSVLLFPVATTLAQTATPPPETRPPEIRHVETRDDRDNTGLWGLLGLTGLLGLSGLRRRPLISHNGMVSLGVRDHAEGEPRRSTALSPRPALHSRSRPPPRARTTKGSVVTLRVDGCHTTAASYAAMPRSDLDRHRTGGDGMARRDIVWGTVGHAVADTRGNRAYLSFERPGVWWTKEGGWLRRPRPRF
jgi:hypothetical protein